MKKLNQLTTTPYKKLYLNGKKINHHKNKSSREENLLKIKKCRNEA
jgi:hypothetical protein